MRAKRTNSAAPMGRVPPPVAPAAPERDYLVIFEEPDPYGLPSDDTLVLGVEGPGPSAPRGEIDVQQKVDIELTNTTNRIGTFGFVVSCLGALVGLVTMVLFAAAYPGKWYEDGLITNAGLVKNLLGASIATAVLLIAGMVFTYYGRRIQAHGNLSAVRIVEKSAHRRIALER